MSEARIITSAWPVVFVIAPVRWESGWVKDLDRKLQPVFGRRERFTLITDTRPIVSIPGAKERKELTDWLADPQLVENQKRYSIGSVTIIENAITRGSLQALYWLWTPPTPQHAVRDLDEGWARCMEMLKNDGVALPTSPSELRAILDRELAREKLGRATPPR